MSSSSMRTQALRGVFRHDRKLLEHILSGGHVG